jgi:hypothetical protein
MMVAGDVEPRTNNQEGIMKRYVMIAALVGSHRRVHGRRPCRRNDHGHAGRHAERRKRDDAD